MGSTTNKNMHVVIYISLGAILLGNLVLVDRKKTSCTTSYLERVAPSCVETLNVKPLNNNTKGKYHYKVTITPASNSEELYEVEKVGNYYKLKKNDSYDYLNGTWEWWMDEYIDNEVDLYKYIKANYQSIREQMNHKSSIQREENIFIPDVFNDNYEEYLEDPEDELRFDPGIYDFSID